MAYVNLPNLAARRPTMQKKRRRAKKPDSESDIDDPLSIFTDSQTVDETKPYVWRGGTEINSGPWGISGYVWSS